MMSLKEHERKRLSRAMSFFTEVKDGLDMSTYWYLTPIAVRSDCQGKGYASKLIRRKLTSVDAEKTECLLETWSTKNVDIYRKFGFYTVREATMPDAGLRHWVMKRDRR